jgi:oligosaccharide repeat unit polymerase
MIIISFIIMLIVFLNGFIFEYKNKSPFLIFYIGLFVLVIYPSFINIFLFDEKLYQDNIYIEANLFSSLYLLVLFLFRKIFIDVFRIKNIWLDFVDDRKNKNYSDLNIIYIILLILCFICFIVGLKLFSFSALMSLNWWDLVRSNSKLVILGTYLSYISCGILIASHFSNNKREKILSYFITTAFLVFSVFVLKTRSYVLMFLVPMFLYLIYSKKGIQLIKPIIFSVIIAFLFVFSRAVRHSSDLNEFLSADIGLSITDASQGAESTFIDAFYYFIYFNNNFPGFEKNFTLIRILLFWFPDFKPVEFSYLMHSAYFGSSPGEGLSMHPTVFGDAYANAWWFGAFIYSIFLAFYISMLESLVRFFDSSRDYFKVIVFSIISIVSLIFARGAIYNAFMYSFLPIIFLFILIYFFNKILKSRFLK